MLGVEGGSQQWGQQGNLRGGRHSSGSPSGGSLEQVRRSTSAAGLKHTHAVIVELFATEAFIL